MIRRPFVWPATAIVLLMLQGCGTVFDASAWGRMLFGRRTLERISIETSEDANGGYPVALDVVLVADEQVYAQLRNLTASEWFVGRQDFIRQNPQNIAVMGWEIVPGQKFSDVEVPKGKTPVGYLLFAGYLGTGSYRSTVQGVKHLWIRLNVDDFSTKAE